jgi:hypothetical protein
MPFFKPKDGPGKIRITFCGYVKDGQGVTLHKASKSLQSANNASDARIMLFRLLAKEGSIKDGGEESVSDSKGYKVGTYSYTESVSNPGTYYHDFKLVNSQMDGQCSSGGRKRRTRKTRSKKNKKSRKTRRNRK